LKNDYLLERLCKRRPDLNVLLCKNEPLLPGFESFPNATYEGTKNSYHETVSHNDSVQSENSGNKTSWDHVSRTRRLLSYIKDYHVYSNTPKTIKHPIESYILVF